MLPQAIVQNSIIGTYNTSGSFNIDWEKADPILNLNFFYIDQLVNESGKYRLLLRPWTEIEAPASGIWPTNGKIHDYYYAIERTTYSDRPVYPGSLVGCISKINNEVQLGVVYPTIGQFLYNEATGTFYFSNDITVPNVFRSFSLAGLKTVHSIALNPLEKALDILDTSITYHIQDNTDWEFNIPGEIYNIDEDTTEAVETFLLLTTDVIFCRVKYNSKIIDEVPVTIHRIHNARLGKYEYSLVIPNHNYAINVNTVLEFY